MDKVIVISVVRDFRMYDRCVARNDFNVGCELLPIDNRENNDGIGVCYNRFLNEYDYSQGAWFVFCHEDWEVEEMLSLRLTNIDKGSLWGVIGAATVRRMGVYAQWRLLGRIEESNKDGSHIRNLGEPVPQGTLVDTFDCQCMVVHSSLVKNHNLRFDENLTFDLYVEDFCIAANEKAGVLSRILPVKCRHWSGGNVQPRYKAQEAYLNAKWRTAGAYTGTSSLLLGGKAPWWWRLTKLIKCFLKEKHSLRVDSGNEESAVGAGEKVK